MNADPAPEARSSPVAPERGEADNGFGAEFRPTGKRAAARQSGLTDLPAGLHFAARERPKALIVALSGIGNFLMASPLFRALKEANSAAEIDVLVSARGTAEIAEGNPRIRRILLGHPKPAIAEWRRMVSEIRRERYDVGLIAHPGQLILSASLLFFGGVLRRIGHRYSWNILRDSAFFLTDGIPTRAHASLPPTDRTAHDVVQNLNLLRPLGMTANPAQALYDFPLGPADHARADAWRTQHGLGASGLVGVHPGAHQGLAYKRWPAERWAAIGDRLAEQCGTTILVFGGPEERALTAEVCARMKMPSVPVEAKLRTAAALIACCEYFISNDSGLMHVAVSQNVPTFGLFGPTDERRTAPWGKTGHVIRAPGTRPTYAVARLRALSAQREADPSLLALSPEDVMQEVTSAVSVRA